MVVTAQANIENLLIRSPWLDQQVDRVGTLIQNKIRDFITQQGDAGTQVRNFLNGVWLGHPLHAAVTDLPVGAWTTGVFFDYLGAITGSRTLQRTGDLATGVGVAGGIVAAIAGLADYSEIESEQRRVGTVHGILNALGLAFMGWSIARRFAGDRAGSLPLSTIGYLLSFVSADIGGLMVYRYGATVNRQAWTEGPTEFTPVCPANQLGEGQLQVGKADGTEVLLTRVGGQIYAIGNRCTHWGCSLAQGQLQSGDIKCHCHGSTFNLATGAVVSGPATSPEPSFDVRERNGQIEVKMRPY